jgi:hypothetical protein
MGGYGYDPAQARMEAQMQAQTFNAQMSLQAGLAGMNAI